MIQRLFHISRNTFRESIRQPIFSILLLTSLGIIGTYPALTFFVFREQEKLVTDGSMATVLLFGWTTAVLVASHAIGREIETGTALLVLSKPVGRLTFLLAKLLGILSALTVFVWITGIATLMSLRVAKDQFELENNIVIIFFGSMVLACILGALTNYLKHTSFTASTVLYLLIFFSVGAVVVYFLPEFKSGRYDWDHTVGYSWNLVRALVLILFAVWAMGTLAAALSTKFGMVSNLTICGAIFVVGLMSDYFYLQLTTLQLKELEQAMHTWHLWVLPAVGLIWLLSAKHFDGRRRRDVGYWEVHATHGLLFGLLLWRGVLAIIQKAYLEEPTRLMRLSAAGIFGVKNAIAEVLHAMIPNWQLFWLADALASKRTIPAAYIGLGASYIAVFIFAFTLLALVLFTSREVGQQAQ